MSSFDSTAMTEPLCMVHFGAANSPIKRSSSGSITVEPRAGSVSSRMFHSGAHVGADLLDRLPVAELEHARDLEGGQLVDFAPAHGKPRVSFGPVHVGGFERVAALPFRFGGQHAADALLDLRLRCDVALLAVALVESTAMEAAASGAWRGRVAARLASLTGLAFTQSSRTTPPEGSCGKFIHGGHGLVAHSWRYTPPAAHTLGPVGVGSGHPQSTDVQTLGMGALGGDLRKPVCGSCCAAPATSADTTSGRTPLIDRSGNAIATCHRAGTTRSASHRSAARAAPRAPAWPGAPTEGRALLTLATPRGRSSRGGCPHFGHLAYLVRQVSCRGISAL